LGAGGEGAWRGLQRVGIEKTQELEKKGSGGMQEDIGSGKKAGAKRKEGQDQDDSCPLAEKKGGLGRMSATTDRKD